MVRSAINQMSHPRMSGAKATAVAAALWTILVKTQWLPIVAVNWGLPKTFFGDAQIAGYVSIVLSLLVRELYQGYRLISMRVSALSPQWRKVVISVKWSLVLFLVFAVILVSVGVW